MIRILSILHRNRFDGVLIPDHSRRCLCGSLACRHGAHVGFMRAALMASSGPRSPCKTKAPHNERNCRVLIAIVREQ